jgi:hypothetical protein
MDHDLATLEESLRHDTRSSQAIGAAGATSPKAPSRFLLAVRSRRRRVVAVRAATMLAVLAIGCVGLIGVWRAVRPPSVPAVHQMVYAGSPAMRKFRELPPETTAGSGTSEVMRVLDARDPRSAGALGGLN